MSSIYSSNRSRNNNNERTKRNVSETNHSKNSHKRSRYDQDDKKRILVASAIVNVITVAVFMVFLFIAVSNSADRAIYAKYVIIPIAAFVGAFISVLLNKDFFMNIAAGAAILFLTYLIFVDFSFMAILWLLFYLLSAVIGIIAAYIAKTFR